MRNLVCLFSIVLAFSVATIFAQNQVVFQSDFEKGTQSWETRGERVSIKSAKDMSATGAKSLKISGRNANWNGTQLSVTKMLSVGKTYNFTVAVKLNKGESPDDVKMTVQGGDTQYYGVAATKANADEWTTFSGKFKPSGSDPYLLLYIEAGRDNTSFYIDDFKIESAEVEIPQQSGVLIKNDFEDMTAQNWFVNDENLQMFSSKASGSQSLKITGRTQNWQGLALDISPLIFKGRTYEISVSAKLLSGEAKDSLKLTIKQTPPKGEPTYTPVSAATEVTDAEWVTLSGTYTGITSDNNLIIYVESAGAKTSYYIDNFMLKVAEKTQ